MYAAAALRVGVEDGWRWARGAGLRVRAAASQLSGLPAVDCATYHMYPQGWGEVPANGKDPVAWGAQWVGDHIALARGLGKPAVLEEYGVQVDPARGVADQAARIVLLKSTR